MTNSQVPLNPDLIRHDKKALPYDVRRLVVLVDGWRAVAHRAQWLAWDERSQLNDLYLEVVYERRPGAATEQNPVLRFAKHLDLWSLLYVNYYTVSDTKVAVCLGLRALPTYRRMRTMAKLVTSDAIKQCANLHLHGLYPTPISVIRRIVLGTIMAWISNPETPKPRARAIMVTDLCAGDGRWGMVAKEELTRLGYSVYLTGIEINEAFQKPPEYRVWKHDNFDNVHLPSQDFIFSNPDFELAEEAVTWAIGQLHCFGLAEFLLPVDFLTAKKFDALCNLEMPVLETKLTKRPGFFQPFSAMSDTYSEASQTVYKSGPNKGKPVWDGKGTNAQNYSSWRYAVSHTYPRLPFERLHWGYDDTDPLHLKLLQRSGMVIAALVREQAKRQKNEPDRPTFTDFYSLMAANKYKWRFFLASDEKRLAVWTAIKRRHMLANLGFDPDKDVGDAP